MYDIAYLYIIFVLVVALGFEIAIIRLHREQRQRHAFARLQKSYIRQIVKMLLCEECRSVYPTPTKSLHRIALTEALHTVLSHTYGTDLNTIYELVGRYHLDTFLLRQIKWSRGTRQAHFILLLSTAPTMQPVMHILQRHLTSRHTEHRTAALLATLAVRPSTAIASIAALHYPLSALDIARIIALLRRGILPIAYEPLLASGNHNLRMLGLAIVRNFGIEIADKQLQNIILSSDNDTVIREAIYTLAALGRPLGRAKIRLRLSEMDTAYRKELCRHLTREGYSLAALRTIFSPSEIASSAALINSYKRDIECTPTLNT